MEINWQIIFPLFFIQIMLIVVALLDWRKRDFSPRIKWVWFFVIVFISMLGPVIYFVFHKEEGA